MSIAVLSIDPGKMTGISLVSWTGEEGDDPVIVLSCEVDEASCADTIEEALKMKDDFETFKVVCEKFTITAQTVRNSQAPYSLEQIGVLKHLCRQYGYPVESITFQAPVDAKNMFPNTALKTIGIWHRGGAGHALDSLRHALLYLVRMRWIPKAILKNN